MNCWYSASGSICWTAAEISWWTRTTSSVSRLLISQYSSRMLFLRRREGGRVGVTLGDGGEWAESGERAGDSQGERHVLLHPLQ